MAMSTKPSKWGSFLQQAVAGVEARLDNILAEGEAAAKPSPPPHEAATKCSSGPPSPSPSNANRPPDSLQERLAKAVGSKPGTPAPATPRSSGVFSRPAEPMADINIASPAQPTSARDGNIIAQHELVPSDGLLINAEPTYSNDSRRFVPPGGSSPEQLVHSYLADQKHVVASDESTDQMKSNSDARLTAQNGPPASVAGTESMCTNCETLQGRVEALTIELNELSPQNSQGVHIYVERVDALESKLRYLAREATDAARKAASSAPAGTVERRLAEKDEKISLLMGEGQALAGTEHKHRALIKKLRFKATEDERTINELNSEKEQVAHEVEKLRKSASRIEELEAGRGELQGLVHSLKKDVSSLRLELEDKSGTIANLETELERIGDVGNSTTDTSNRGLADSQLSRLAELEEMAASLQVEKKLLAERASLQVAELHEKAELAMERELQAKGEMQVLEGKLEAMRMVAEEASSGAIGDTQAKLLRQVETLQSQYASARENWQGIETSLASRISTLEKERDDAIRRESEMRRKAKELSLRCRQQEEELQNLRDKAPHHKLELETSQSETESLKRRAEAAEAALSRAREENEKLKEMESVEIERRGGNGETNLMGLPSSSRAQSRPHSPLSILPRTFSSDLVSHGLSSDRPSSARRPSGQPPLRTPVLGSMMGTPSSQGFPAFGSPLEYPRGAHSIGGDRDESSDHIDTLSSSQQAAQDVFSVSTVAAGPSIQLVERMSAGVRRLEAEKVATKEELARISSQRDEARAEIVSLMKEIEASSAASKRVQELEKEVVEINSRYQTTLEMLGEKSELVEELRADVQDVKAMYRELVERTVT